MLQLLSGVEHLFFITKNFLGLEAGKNNPVSFTIFSMDCIKKVEVEKMLENRMEG